MTETACSKRDRLLAERIEACLHEADHAHLPLVAAHLDAALVALRGEGIWPANAFRSDSGIQRQNS